MQPSSAAAPAPARSPYARLKHWVHATVEPDVDGGQLYDQAIVWLICLNVVAMIMETVEPLHAAHRAWFHAFEVFSVAVFVTDYVLRLWSCTVWPEYAHPVKGRLRFALTPMALIDLASVLPALLPFLGVDLRWTRAVRAVRLLRLAKLARYSHALRMVTRVGRSKAEELISAFLLAGVLLLVASVLMYFAERDAQPDKFSSIPAAMWWGIATLTTVGYGDVYPVTALGKFLSAVIAVLGIGVVALPTGILGAAFVEEMQAEKERRQQKAAAVAAPVVVVLCSRCQAEIPQGEGGHAHAPAGA